MSKGGKLTVVLQAGGESKRMGRSKATVPFLGEPMLWRGVNRLLPLADEFIVTTNEPENLGFLGEHLETGRIRLVRDIDNVRGALHGVHTALASATCDYVAMVACDMIFPSRNLIAAELTALQEKEVDVVVPVTKFGYEPFHGVYRRETCLAATLEALENGESKVTSLTSRVKTFEFTNDMVLEAEPRGGCFINVNTPQELADVERRIIEDEIHIYAPFIPRSLEDE